MRLNTKPLLAALALTMTAGLMFTGCATGGAKAADAAANSTTGSLPELTDSDQVDIVFESYNLSGQGIWGDTIQNLMESFHKAHPNITVKGQGVDSANVTSSVQQEVLAGKAPDIAQMTFDTMSFSQESLNAVNLSQVVGTDQLEEQFGGQYPYHAKAKGLADIDGSTYGLPYVFSTPVLWVNENLLKTAGVNPKTVDLSTWDAVAKASQAVTDKTGKPSLLNACVVSGGNWCMQSMFKSNGAQVLSADRKTIEFGSARAADTVKTFQAMDKSGILGNEDANSQMEAFARGDKYAFLVTTSAGQATFMQGAKANKWSLAAKTLPTFGGQKVVPTNSGSALVMYSQDPKKQAAAWEFMKWMTSPDAYQKITTGIGYLPLRSTMTEDGGPLHDFVQDNPLVKPNLEQLDDLSPWVSYPGEQFAQVDKLLATAIEDSVFQGKDPQPTMTEAARRSQELIGK